MIAALRRLLASHGSNVLIAVISRGLVMLLTAGGTRLLTEFVPANIYGEFKMLEGVVVLGYGLLPLRVVQFVQRGAHDADRNQEGRAFDEFARERMQKVALGAAVCAFLILIALHLFRGQPGLAGCIIVPVMLAVISRYELERGLLMTRNQQFSVAVMDVVRVGAVPALAVLTILMVGPSAWAPILAGIVVLAALAQGAAFRARRTGREAGSQGGEGVAQNRALLHRQWSTQAVAFLGPLLPLGILSWIVNLGDRYLLAALGSSADVGRYAAVYALVMMPSLALASVGSLIMSPIWFKRSSVGDVAGAKRVRTLLLLYVCSIGVVWIGVISVFGEWMASVVLAVEYRAGVAELMLWLAVGAALLTLGNAVEIDAFASKRTRRTTIAYGFAAVVNVVLNLLLIPDFGAVGAGMATAAALGMYVATSVVLVYLEGVRPDRESCPTDSIG